MNKLILIDGSSLLSSGFYATLGNSFYSAKTKEEKEAVYKKTMQTSDGVYTNAIVPMLKMIKNLIMEQRPTHIAIAWDITRDTFRRKLYPEYKGTRDATPYPLKEQFKTMQSILSEMNIAQFMDSEYEADDFIGTLAECFKDEAAVYIYTKDQDVLQLVDDNVKVFLISTKADELNEKYAIDKSIFKMPPGTFTHNLESVKSEYGVEPYQFVDLKAIIGDKSDNIPGVKGVGEKAAIPLLCEYKTLEAVYEAIDESEVDDDSRKAFKEFLKKDLGISRSPVKSFIEQRDLAFLSKELATIKRDIDIKGGFDSLKMNINKEKSKEQFVKYELKSLLS